MTRNTFAARLFLLSVLAGGFDAFAVAVAHAAEPPPVAALVNAGSGLLEWAPLVDSESITLTLADPQGRVRTFHFGPGEAPALSLFDAQGMPLPDGTYTWELRATPRLSADLKQVSAPLVQSGHFTLAGGALVAPDIVERPERQTRQGTSQTPRVTTAPDQMVPDDLIVDGKGCIGLGCNNNEAFGQEALRLKQSVVRLRFEDTSAQAGFPTHDWQLTVNDSASGGADRFSIEDLTAGTTPLTVRGGAPSNSLYVNGNGWVGIGTAAPGGSLHLYGSANADVFAGMGTDLIAGPAFNYGYSGWSFGRSSGFFNVRPDSAAVAPNPSLRFLTANVQRMIIDNEGFIGLGVANPTSPIHHSSGALLTAGGTWQNASSRNLKQDIRELPAEDALSALAQLVPVRFHYKAEPEDESVGFIAEDVPELVAAPDRKTLSPMDIVAVLTRAVQEQQTTIEKQQELIGQLEERLRRLEVQEHSNLQSVVQP
jgi:hypothetical protein